MCTSLPFDICQFTENNFYKSLGNSYVDPVEIASYQRPSYLYGYLKHLNAQTIFIEKDYIDGDYLEDFVAFYARCFRKYSRICKRIHFFERSLKTEDFLNIVRGNSPLLQDVHLQESYLGFIVVRPLPRAIVGRTVLKTYEADGNRRHYKVTRKYSANLFGIELNLESLAFQEQDRAVSACATVSLWCCFHKTAKLFGTPAPRPAKITLAANQVARDARPMPSHGLSIEQMCNAISHIGLEAEVFNIDKRTPLISIMYSYLMMELPVILIAEAVYGSDRKGLHAITLTGFSMIENIANQDEIIPTKSKHINEFYGHDDQTGPFAKLLVKGSLDKNEYSIMLEMPDEKIYLPKNIIIPVYDKIRLSFIDVLIWIKRLESFLAVTLPQEKKSLWDIYLIQVNDYKKILRQEIPNSNTEALILDQHPKFIWKSVLEIDGMKSLEILADATEMPGSFPIYRIIWHDNSLKEELDHILNLINADEQIKHVTEKILTKTLFNYLITTCKP